MKKILTYLLALSLCMGLFFALTSCNECDPHTDADWNYVCDVCEENIPLVNVDYTITICDQDALPVENVTLTLSQGSTDVATLTTNEAGIVSGNVVAGPYTVTFDSRPSGYYPDSTTASVLITPDNASLSFTFENTIPNGSLGRPFPVIEDTTEVTLDAGETFYYHSFGIERVLIIENAPVTVTAEDHVYSPDENGRIEVLLTADDVRDGLPFSITNTGAEEATFTFTMQSPLGSMENPIEATLDTTYTPTVKKGSTIYYIITAEEDGYITFTSTSTSNDSMLYNLTSYRVTSLTNGALSCTIAVKAGDRVRLEVSTKGNEAQTTIEFILTFTTETPSAEE